MVVYLSILGIFGTRVDFYTKQEMAVLDQPFALPKTHSPAGVGGLVVHIRRHYQRHLESAERYKIVQKAELCKIVRNCTYKMLRALHALWGLCLRARCKFAPNTV